MAPGTPHLTLLRMPACLPHRPEASAGSPINATWEASHLALSPFPLPLSIAMSSTSREHYFNHPHRGFWQEEFQGRGGHGAVIVLRQKQRRK